MGPGSGLSQRLRESFESKMVRKLSPSGLMPSTVIKMAMPGKTVGHGARNL